MVQILPFRDHALIQLREQVAMLDAANADLLAFAKGHTGAVSQIHAAVLAAMDADDFERFVHIVTQEWPLSLGLDVVVIALASEGQGVRLDASGIHIIDPRLIEDQPPVVMRIVDRGAGVFGPARPLVRAEALMRLELAPAAAQGVLALGSRHAQAFESSHGSQLLAFLGEAVARMIGRWLIDQ